MKNYKFQFNKNSAILVLMVLILVWGFDASSQSFKQGSFNISISGGSTNANYRTTYTGAQTETSGHKRNLDGIRDPLILEYGLTKHIGIGISIGNDIFEINPSNYYGFSLPGNKKVTVNTSEFNFDLSYHFYTNQMFDFSGFSSIGSFGVKYSGSEKYESADEIASSEVFNYDYHAKGQIVRVGTRAKFYVLKRLAVLSMLSVYSGNAKPLNKQAYSVGGNYNTRITGYAVEFGLSFRVN